jgi:hypothetical protein
MFLAAPNKFGTDRKVGPKMGRCTRSKGIRVSGCAKPPTRSDLDWTSSAGLYLQTRPSLSLGEVMCGDLPCLVFLGLPLATRLEIRQGVQCKILRHNAVDALDTVPAATWHPAGNVPSASVLK